MPEIAPTTYNIPKIVRFSFFTLFTLNSINMPIPELTSNPAIIEPTVIIFSKYNCVNITDDAQFGIKPTKLDITGPNIGTFNIKCAIFSSPIR